MSSAAESSASAVEAASSDDVEELRRQLAGAQLEASRERARSVAYRMRSAP